MKKPRSTRSAPGPKCQAVCSTPHNTKPANDTSAFRYANDGADIVMSQTTFWESLFAHMGGSFLTWNDGVARLLIPNSWSHFVDHMCAADFVVISRGPYPHENWTDCFEILFDDGTETPAHMFISVRATHMMPCEADMPREFPLTVWTHEGKLASFSGRFRRTKQLPLLTPWTDSKVVIANQRLADALDRAYMGEFVEYFFPYVHRHAVNLSRGSVDRVDWQCLQLAENVVVVAPMQDDYITAYSHSGETRVLSPEAFGVLCCWLTFTDIYDECKAWMSTEAIRCFKALANHALTHPDRDAMVPSELQLHRMH